MITYYENLDLAKKALLEECQKLIHEEISFDVIIDTNEMYIKLDDYNEYNFRVLKEDNMYLCHFKNDNRKEVLFFIKGYFYSCKPPVSKDRREAKEFSLIAKVETESNIPF